MKGKLRAIIRGIIAAASIIVIVVAQRSTGKEELAIMLGALAVLLLTLFDYNYAFNHPKRD